MTPKGVDGSPCHPALSIPTRCGRRDGAGAEEPTLRGLWRWGGISLSVATEDLEVFREPGGSRCVLMQHPEMGERGGQAQILLFSRCESMCLTSASSG